MKPTLTDPELRTYFPVRGLQAACRRNESAEDKAACVTIENAGCDKMVDEPCDGFQSTPWRAPGFAGLDMPCGIAGGGFVEDLQTGCLPPKDRPMGFDGRDLPEYQGTTWPAGSVQEVSWGFTANHGGGYAYRLCPASAKLTEECFERGHLKFVGESWLQHGSNTKSRKAYNATRVSEGTHPPGSMWTKHPIPACKGGYGGAQHCQPNDHAGMNCTCDEPQFEPKVPGVFGFGIGHCVFPLPEAHGYSVQCKAVEMMKVTAMFSTLNIVDQVQIPADLPPGDYVVSWRWDCEQTPQIWAGCADVTITEPEAGVVV
jgi:hypothetical protein